MIQRDHRGRGAPEMTQLMQFPKNVSIQVTVEQALSVVENYVDVRTMHDVWFQYRRRQSGIATVRPFNELLFEISKKKSVDVPTYYIIRLI